MKFRHLLSSCFRPDAQQPNGDVWANVLDRASRSVVMLKMNTVRCFETTMPSISISSGFVVDKKQGIILTNRHVVQAGPVVGKASFINNEEVPVFPLYRDPEHDFGFLKYDPASVKHMIVEELQLFPQGAQIGTEIRVIGSDAGEKLMVLAGTLAQDSRECPAYSGLYQDLNTFYLASSSSTSGGSSGAPVLDSRCRVIGLNAGAATMAASSFFLPLDRVGRALQAIRTKSPILRGTLLTVFGFLPMDECRRLGLVTEEEKILRQAQQNNSSVGALVVSRVVEKGAGFNAGLLTGDILLRINGSTVCSFIQLEDALDGNIGKEITFTVQRGSLTLDLKVIPEDLNQHLPSELIEYSSGVFHPLGSILSYQSGVHPSAVMVLYPGFSFEKAGIGGMSVITQIDGQNVTCLDDLGRIFAVKKDKQKVLVRYYQLGRKGVEQTAVVKVDRNWHPMIKMVRNDTDSKGLWTQTILDEAWAKEHLPSPSAESQEQFEGGQKDVIVVVKDGTNVQVSTTQVVSQQQEGSTVVETPAPVVIDQAANTALTTDDQVENGNDQNEQEGEGLSSIAFKPEEGLERQASFKALNTASGDVMEALVYISFFCPSRIDGIGETAFEGCGVVINAELGLVWCDRRTVVSCLGDIQIVFGGVLEVDECKVVFLHPSHNFALIQFNVAALKGRKVRAVEPFAPSELEPDLMAKDKLTFVGLTRQRQVQMMEDVSVLSVERGSVETPKTPCFTAKSIDRVELDKAVPANSINGVFLDSQQRARAFSSYFFVQHGQADVILCTLSAPVRYALDRVRSAILNGKPVPPCYTLGLELGIVRLGEAKDVFGMSDAWFEKLAQAADQDYTGAGRNTRDVLKVYSMMAGTEPAQVLEFGDIILDINDKPVVSYQAFETAAMVAGDTNSKVKLTVLRELQEVKLECRPHCLSPQGTQRIIKFCGMQVQETHPSVLYLGFVPSFLLGDESSGRPLSPGVYISGINLGSPAECHGIDVQRWISSMNGQTVSNLDEFMDVVRGLNQGDLVRITCVGLNQEESVHALDVDLHYFPLTDLRFDPQTGIWSSAKDEGVLHW